MELSTYDSNSKLRRLLYNLFSLRKSIIIWSNGYGIFYIKIMKEDNHFDWPDATRNDLMYLSTISICYAI
jgi:hypothetical protein